MSTYTTVRTDFGTDVVDPEGEHVEEHMSAARAALLADALNVHEATGLTASQLQARVAELEAALREGMETLDATGDMPDRLIHPDAWRKLNCEKKIAEFRRMLGEA